MALSNDFEIITNNDWVEILNTGNSFDLQNISGITLEYTYSTPIEHPSVIEPNSWITGNGQSVFVRIPIDIKLTSCVVSLVRSII